MLEDPPCLVTRFIDGRADDVRASCASRRCWPRSPRRCAPSTAAGELPVAFDSFRIVEDYAARATERGADLPADYEWATRRRRRGSRRR